MSELANSDFCLELSGKAVRDLIQTTLDNGSSGFSLDPGTLLIFQQQIDFQTGAVTAFYKGTLTDFEVQLQVSSVNASRLSANWVISFDCGWLNWNGVNTFGFAGTITFQMEFNPVVRGIYLVLQPLDRTSTTDYPSGAPAAKVVFTHPVSTTYTAASPSTSTAPADLANNLSRQWADGLSHSLAIAFGSQPKDFAINGITVDSTQPGDLLSYRFMTVQTITVTNTTDTSFCLLATLGGRPSTPIPVLPPIPSAKTIGMRKGHDAAAFVAGWAIDHFFVRPHLGAQVLGVTTATEAQLASLPPLFGSGGPLNIGFDTFLFRFNIALDPFVQTMLEHLVQYTECRGFDPSILAGDKITSTYRHGFVGDCYDMTLPVKVTYTITNGPDGPSPQPPSGVQFGGPSVTINGVCIALELVLLLVPIIGPELTAAVELTTLLPALLQWFFLPGMNQSANVPGASLPSSLPLFQIQAAHTVDAENAFGLQLSTTGAPAVVAASPSLTASITNQAGLDTATFSYTTQADGCPPNKTYSYSVQRIQQTWQLSLAIPDTLCRPYTVAWFALNANGTPVPMPSGTQQTGLEQVVQVTANCQLPTIGGSYPVTQSVAVNYQISSDTLTATLINQVYEPTYQTGQYVGNYTLTVQCVVKDGDGGDTVATVNVPFVSCNVTGNQQYINDVAACAAIHAIALQNVKVAGETAAVFNGFIPPWVLASDVPDLIQPIYEQIGLNATASTAKIAAKTNKA